MKYACFGYMLKYNSWKYCDIHCNSMIHGLQYVKWFCIWKWQLSMSI